MTALASLAVPLFVALILLCAVVRRVPLFDEFCAGAKEGLYAAAGVLPPLVALMTAVSALRACGFTEWLVAVLQPVTQAVGFPAEALPSALLRPLSGSGSLAALQQMFEEHGTESFQSLVASVLQCSTETTFYTLTVYFGSVGIQRTGCAFPAALVGDMAGMILAPLTVRLLLM